MSGTDRLTDEALEKWVESLDEKAFWEGPVTFESYQLSELHSIARELLAHRRASQAAPAPSDGLREALAALEAKASAVSSAHARKGGIGFAVSEMGPAIIAARDALTASPAQEGGE